MRRDDARGATPTPSPEKDTSTPSPRKALGAPAPGTPRVFEASLEPEKIVTLREIEDAFIDDVLTVFEGNKMKTARVLGVDRRTLYRRLAARKQRRR